jgi:hypothetical protein
VDETNPSSAKSNRKAPTLEFNQGVRAELYFQLPDLGLSLSGFANYKPLICPVLKTTLGT